jgi:hypothetical protein
MCVRNDGLMYDPEIGPHGERSRPTTQRMVWYPRDESPEQYRERMRKDTIVDEIKPLMDHYGLNETRAFITNVLAVLRNSIAAAAEATAEMTAEAPENAGGEGASGGSDPI